LWQAVLATSNIRGYYGARVVAAHEQANHLEVVLATEGCTESETLSAQLLIGADGTHSKVRELMGVAFEQTHYQAWAFLAQATSRQPHNGWAYERFTPQGPVALLPIGSHDHKLVYVVPEADKTRVESFNDDEFLAAFYTQMGVRMGGFERISARLAYPLTEGRAPHILKGRMVLMGNACHTQHPVAAQGLNLGLRDVSDFLATTSTGTLSQSALVKYEAQRLADHQQVMRLTDGLIRVFQHPSPLVGHLRGFGLMALQALPPLKKRLAAFASRGRSVN
jgi:2-octaprenyl-6-methoxyphenol hydroxylase